ncbi:hypothetical protein Snoj_41080 [Streptomyces nojiriensis]|uniref:Uncharacterized protein n=1 Tax=Streptomyces nojiriensis TaxID=66374 RepID=A0ABQ3SPW2_9ACTN|nr:hypothetical protein GCM10010205_09730 [Streptomyces nojiriensis]GHI70190.1 hypothetical protein Snoj_41080 [Streptomyces nojiriensis]
MAGEDLAQLRVAHALHGVGAPGERAAPARRPRSRAVAKAARRAGRMGHQLAHPLGVTLRNAAVRLTPSRTAVRMILRHHAWEPPGLG